MTLYLTEAFDSGSTGTNLSNSNTSSDLISGTAPKFDSDSHDGALSMFVNQTAATASSARFQLGAARSEVYVSFWIKISSWPSGNGSPLAVRSGSTIKSDLQTPGGIVRMRGAGTGQSLQWTAPTALPTNQWLLFEHHLKVSGSIQDLVVYAADGTTLLTSGPQAWAAASTVDNVVVGSTSAIADVVWWQDTLIVADVPIVPPIPPVVLRWHRKLAGGELNNMIPRRHTLA